MEEFLKVGVITTTHGLRGEVKVFPTTDDKKRFKLLKEVWLKREQDAKLEALLVQQVKFFKKLVILKLAGLDDISDVECLRGKELFIPRKEGVPLAEGEFYIADLIGLLVVDEEEKALGTLLDVMETGANDVYVVKMTDGKELLLPAIKDCIRQIDLEQRKIKVHLMEGLL